ncbi:MAG: hypothetical protein HOA60_02420 [Rhodospirillales bacterium]|nr:hypothetical protein [Rhodospirillales bacterium]
MSDAPDAGNEVAALQSDAGFMADWSGENGRSAQIAAVERKSALHEQAYGGEQETIEPIMSEQVAEGLKAEDSVSQEAAAAMIPAQDVSEYHFNWQGQADMELEQLAEINTVAKEAAFAMGANPHYAQQTIEFIDQQLTRTGIVPCGDNPESVVEVLNQRLGQNAAPTIAAAKAACAKLPAHSREWLFKSMDQLDASGFAYIIARLASIQRANS